VRAERVVLALAALLAGCAAAAGPPRITRGDPCAVCGMAIQDLRYAAAREAGRTWRVYDSIECLLREGAPGAAAWLPDYDSGTLHAADSMWVVRGDLPSPMGGGFVAFAARATADEVAARTRGRVDRLEAFPAGVTTEAAR
jgi:nitrous oxide reductase accessory protein NosL